MKKNTIAYIIGLLTTSEERKNLENAFQQLDTDKDGLLSFKEIKAGYQKVLKENFTLEQLKQIFMSVDTDGSGYIDYNEFISATMDQALLFTQEKLKMLFKKFDRNNTGTISLQEFYSSLGNIKKGSEQFLDQIMKGALEGNQQINYEAFLEILNVKIDSSEMPSQSELKQIQQIIKQNIQKTKLPIKVEKKKLKVKFENIPDEVLKT